MAQVALQVLQVMTHGWTTGRLKAERLHIDVLQPIVESGVEAVLLVLMFKRCMAMITAGTSCLFVEVVTIAPTSFM